MKRNDKVLTGSNDRNEKIGYSMVTFFLGVILSTLSGQDSKVLLFSIICLVIGLILISLSKIKKHLQDEKLRKMTGVS